MSQNANAKPAGGTNAKPVGGLKSTLKIAVPIVALMGVIFGVTLLSMYTPPKPSDEDPGKKPGDTGPIGREPPLRFFNSTRSWDPPSLAQEYREFPLLAPSRDPSKAELPFSFSMQDRIFQGFYEPDKEKVRSAPFWFENRNPHPVTMQLKGVSCSACSEGRVAAIPPAVLKAYLHRTALASLPIGVFNGFGVGLADPAADFAKLEWTRYKFSDNPNAAYKIPAAEPTDRWAPQWGILELMYTVSEKPNVPLRAAFATQVEGTQQTGAHEFAIFFSASEPFSLSRPTIDIGEVTQLTGDREYTFLVYSATRGPNSEFGDLVKPGYEVQAPTGVEVGKFVEVTKVERLPNSELLDVVQDAAKSGKFTKVQAAYRVTVTVRQKVGDARLDLGLLERTVFVTVGSAKPQSVQVTAMIRGPVWLANGKTDIEISFKGRLGLTSHIIGELVTEAPGMELALVEDQCKPRYCKYELVKKPERGGRGSYELKITVPPGRVYAAIDSDAIIVVEVKGANPQRIRIPVKGKGETG